MENPTLIISNSPSLILRDLFIEICNQMIIRVLQGCKNYEFYHVITVMNRCKTVVLGASTNPERASHQATLALQNKGFDVIPLGIKNGTINGLFIQSNQPLIENIHTITLYVGPENQPPLYDYILKLKPQRLIFNPGTENPELSMLARQNGIETVRACTLVMLTLDEYDT